MTRTITGTAFVRPHSMDPLIMKGTMRAERKCFICNKRGRLEDSKRFPVGYKAFWQFDPETSGWTCGNQCLVGYPETYSDAFNCCSSPGENCKRWMQSEISTNNL